MNPDSSPAAVFSLSEGEVTAWIDGGIHLKAATAFGDPVELSEAEARSLIAALSRLLDDLERA